MTSFLALLRFVPLWVWAAGSGAVLAAVGVWHLEVVHEAKTAGMAQVQARWDAERAVVAEATGNAISAARAEEQRRVVAQQGIVDEALKKAQESAAGKLAADTAADGLRKRAAALAARCGVAASHSSAAGPGPATGEPGIVLADVLGRLESAGRQLAEVATARGIAGEACVASYEALKGTP